MTKLGELGVEQLLDGADKDAAYLVERLEKLARERGADPDDIEEVVTRATTAHIRSQLIVAQLRLREQDQAGQNAATPTPDTGTKPERSERESAEAMTAVLVALGVTAETINTGGNCWSSSITLTKFARLELNDFTGAWSWSLYQHAGEQVICGHWDSADDQAVAHNTKALIDAMGSIIA
nr:hypothetical protein OG781_42440 [Streptomyces sp. NBC_00830]